MVPLIKGVSKTHEDPAFNTEQLRIKYYSQGDHLRQYGTEDFLIRIKEAGFSVDSLDINYFGETAFKTAGISPNSKLYIVKNI